MDEEKMTMNEAEEAGFLEGLEEALDTTPADTEESTFGDTPGTEATTDTAEALEQTVAEVSAEETAKEVSAEASNVAPTVRIKFNHEERDLSLEEAATLAQKGLKLESELAKMRSAPEFAVLDRMAKASGMTREQYIAQVQQMESERAQREAEDAVRRQYPDAPDELIRETVTNRRAAEAERERAQREQEELLRQKLMKDARDEAQNRDMTAFLEAYPDIRDFEHEIPTEVWERVRGGESLLPAYRAFENEQLRAEVEQLRQNEKNRERAVGSMTGAGEVQGDDFLDGLFG